MNKENSIVIFGSGSIGKRHYEVSKNIENCEVYISSKSALRNIQLRELGYKIFNFDKKCDLGIIASEASKHLKDFKNNFKYAEKWIIEKPLFSIYSNEIEEVKDILSYKNIFIGYNKRFELGIDELKKYISNQKIVNAHFKCFSNLENWRNESISRSISLDFYKGGGVINELSHEIDLANYLLGSIRSIKGKKRKRKYHDSMVEDTAFLKLFHKNGMETKVDISFGCSKEIRKSILFLDKKKVTYNHISGILECKLRDSNKLLFHKSLREKRNKSFERQIKSILFDNYSYAVPCSLIDGLSYVKMLKKL